MTFFFGSNPLVDTILKRYILEKEDFIYSSVGDLEVCDKIVLSVCNDSWPLPDEVMAILGTKKTYIFFDLHSTEGGVESGFEVMAGNVVMIHFRSLSGVLEDAIYKKLIPIIGTPYCDVHIFFREMDKLFRLKANASSFHLMTGEIPEVEKVKNYFDRGEISSFYQPEPVKEVIQKWWSDLFKVKKRVNIFIPTYYRVEKAKKSILSIMEGAKNSKHECVIYIGDNNSQDSELLDFLESIKDRAVVFFSCENLGKARMINLLRSREIKKPDYIFSIDSDMVMSGFGPLDPKLGEEVNQIDGMIELLERGHNIGLVSSFQTGQSEHWFGRTVFESKERGYRIGESKTGIGVAGGCICMRGDDWDLVGGYEEGYDIYTADDAILMDKIDKILKKRAVVGIDFPFYHPPNSEDDLGYTKWKRERFLKDGLKYSEREYKKKELGKGYYDN